MSADPDDLLTVAEVAELTRAPLGTLRYWRSVNQGPRSFRLGAHVVYRRGDVEAWIEQQERDTARGGVA